jgi:glycosyltransferase involved in cell wall biosynthesis
MLIGSIGYETHQGLGYLMRDYYQHGIVQRVWPVTHRAYRNYPGAWYKKEDRYNDREAFCQGLTALLLFETGFDWKLVRRAKELGAKIVVIPNYEYTPFPFVVEPDLMLCGSLLDLDYYQERYHCKFLNVPVSTERFPHHLRTKALRFVHNAGHGQRGFAKGTPAVLEAMKHTRPEIQLTVRGQPDARKVVQLCKKYRGAPNIEFDLRELGEEELYRDFDVFVNAEEYNGLSLPLQEAYASGLGIITTDRYPMNTWLPSEGLLPVSTIVRDRLEVDFERSIVDPLTIARKMNEFYGQDISELSTLGKQWGESHNWEALTPVIKETIECLV